MEKFNKKEFEREFNNEDVKKETSPLRIVEFSQIGRDIPLYKESNNVRGGFINFGDDNLMPNYYVSLLDRSPKHNAIVHQKASMISGNGIIKKDLSNEALRWINNQMNDDDMEEIVARIGYDLEVFGAFLLNLVWSKDRTRIAEINYMNPQTMRIVTPDKDHPNEEYYLISKDWTNINKPDNKPVLYQGFSTINRENASQLLYCKTYQAGKYFYGVPEYISGARWCEMEFEISQWHLSNIKNGFAPSMFINFPTGIPTDEEIVDNDRKLMKQLAGPKGGGKAFITYSEDKDSAPIIVPIETNQNDSKYIELNEIITEGILAAHRVNDPALFGLAHDTGIFAGQTQILNSLETFRAQYVIPKQRFIEKCLNRLARINGITDTIELAHYELNFSKMDVSITDLLAILQSTISDDAKRNLLILNGYSEEDANKLVMMPVTQPGSTPLPGQPVQHNEAPTDTAVVNEALKGLSAAANSDMYRIIRDFTKGKINETLALTRLMAYGIDEDTAKKILGVDEETKNNPIQ